MAALSLEASGFARRGEGWRLAEEGAIAVDGSLPISTMGGLKNRGHPVGATGVYQIVEVVQQLTGQAGANQVQETPGHGAEYWRQRGDRRYAYPQTACAVVDLALNQRRCLLKTICSVEHCATRQLTCAMLFLKMTACA